ncbi:hypothetical protein OXX80_013840, partial [Metschnikowia pulcherrima]
MVKSTLIYRYD